MTRSNLATGFSQQWGRTVYRCADPRCNFAREVREPQGYVDLEHKCPQVNGTTKVSWTVYGPSLLQQTWDELDLVTEKLMFKKEECTDADKGYARGLAFTLSLFMVPHLRTPEEVAREAVKRIKAKQAGELYETPGLGSRTYEPPPGDNKYSADGAEKQKVMRTRKASLPVQKQFTNAEVAAIKNAGQMFSVEELATIYEVTVDQIQVVLALQAER